MSAMPTPTLAEVAQQYEHWRNTRSSSYGETPEHLQRQTIALLGQYRIREVINTLGLCHKVIKRWRQRWDTAEEKAVTNAEEFVVLPSGSAMDEPDQLSSPHVLAMKLSHQRSDGTVVSIEAQLPQPQWQAVLQMLQPWLDHDPPDRTQYYYDCNRTGRFPRWHRYARQSLVFSMGNQSHSGKR